MYADEVEYSIPMSVLAECPSIGISFLVATISESIVSVLPYGIDVRTPNATTK